MTDQKRARVAEIADAHVARIMMIQTRGLCPHGCSAACATDPCEAWPKKDDAIREARQVTTERIDAIYSEGVEPGDCFVDIAASVGGPTNVRCETHDKELTVPPSESRLRKALEEANEDLDRAGVAIYELVKALEEIMHRVVAYREHVASGSQPKPNAASTVRDIGDIARRALSATPESDDNQGGMDDG